MEQLQLQTQGQRALQLPFSENSKTVGELVVHGRMRYRSFAFITKLKVAPRDVQVFRPPAIRMLA